MAVLVDTPLWLWRDQRWGHLVSDSSYAELHRFANGLGLRRLAFQGDHYDLPAAMFDHAVRAGARHVNSREIVRSLRVAGLRHRASLGWTREVWLPETSGAAAAAALADHRFGVQPGFIASARMVAQDAASCSLAILHRPGQIAVGLTMPHSESGLTPPHPTTESSTEHGRTEYWRTALAEGGVALDWIADTVDG